MIYSKFIDRTMGNDGFKQLIYNGRDRIVEITLNRPDVLNALSLDLYTELGDALVKAGDDARAQVIVITGAGRAFSSGGDLKQQDLVNRNYPELLAAASHRMFNQILQTDKTVVAKVNGIAQAGGLLIVAASDLAIASERATFKCPEALVGIWEPYSPILLTPQIGLKRAKQLLLASETFDAFEAERVGLINRVAPHEDLDAATQKLVEHILAGGPVTRRKFKQMINKHLVEFDQRVIAEALSSDEAQEGMAAFTEKRRPRWQQ
jgi:enoyl-CoA hydratase/carnithine racemase